MSFQIPRIGEELVIDGIRFRVTGSKVGAKDERDLADRRRCTIQFQVIATYQEKDWNGAIETSDQDLHYHQLY